MPLGRNFLKMKTIWYGVSHQVKSLRVTRERSLLVKGVG